MLCKCKKKKLWNTSEFQELSDLREMVNEIEMTHEKVSITVVF